MAFFDKYTVTVPEEPSSYCPPQEELRMWNDMLFKNKQKKDYRDQAVVMGAVQIIHRCILHLVSLSSSYFVVHKTSRNQPAFAARC